jgi:superfamily II DNA or RNA helicase
MTRKEREQTLEAFEKAQLLISVDALTEGLNVPDADGAICVSGVSTELTQIQSLGRIIRVKEGKQALFINLYVPDTQEEVWIKNKTKNLKNVQWHRGTAPLPKF